MAALDPHEKAGRVCSEPGKPEYHASFRADIGIGKAGSSAAGTTHIRVGDPYWMAVNQADGPCLPARADGLGQKRACGSKRAVGSADYKYSWSRRKRIEAPDVAAITPEYCVAGQEGASLFSFGTQNDR